MKHRKESKQRRAFSQIGGVVSCAGDPESARLLSRAWEAASGDGRLLTHGFHPYPARVHPLLIRSLLEAYSQPGQLVVDPFSGSGTVVVEALAAGRRAIGTEINRVALSVAWTRLLLLGGPERRQLEESASTLASRAARSRSGHVPVDLPGELARQFSPTTLLELTTLRNALETIADDPIRTALRMVLSSLVVKLSRRLSETNARSGDGRNPAGITYRLFKERTTELALALRDLKRAAHDGCVRPLLVAGDARQLPLRDGSVDLVLTSPPYLGTYDYAEVQHLREAFLGLPPGDRSAREIGSRSGSQLPPTLALKQYRQDLTAVLREARRILRPGRSAILVLGDSTVGDTFVDADQVVRDAALAAGLSCVARSSQTRPKARKGPAREHLIALSRP
ncbi:MAG: DNA methyltransferase [Planctomycetota bacterium]